MLGYSGIYKRERINAQSIKNGHALTLNLCVRND
jgi:hypothetical protein